ncbi:MAG: tetratricopeptide repeat protein [Candidatus Odinarchaeota archaeon]
MTLKQLKELYEGDRYQEILEEIEKMKHQGKLDSLSLEEQAWYSYYKSCALEALSRFEDAFQEASRARARLEPRKYKLLDLALLVAQIYPLNRLNKDEAFAYIGEGEKLIRSLTESEREAGAEWISLFLNAKGNFHLDKGEIDSSLRYYQRSLSLREKIGTQLAISSSLNNIGNCYLHKGELDSALDYYKRSLSIAESLGNIPSGAVYLMNIGVVYKLKGELDKAKEYQQKSLSLHEKIGSDYHTAYTLGLLVFTTVEMQDYDLAREYLKRFQVISEHLPVKLFHQAYRVASALILKQSKRMKDKIKAQNLLNDVIDEGIANFYLEAYARIYLCELLLLELKVSGEPEVLAEIKNHANELQILAQDQHSFLYSIHVLLLNARLAVIEGEFQQAIKYLDQATVTAEEKDMGTLLQTVIEERELLENEFKKWQELIQRNAPLQERLEAARLEKYIERAQKMASSIR